MKFKFDKKMLVQIAYLLVLLVIAPFAFEILILADFVGVEFAVTFMLFYFRNSAEDFIQKCYHVKHDLIRSIDALSAQFIFQPKNYLFHASASCLVLVLLSSTFFACALWMPIFALNYSGFS